MPIRLSGRGDGLKYATNPSKITDKTVEGRTVGNHAKTLRRIYNPSCARIWHLISNRKSKQVLTFVFNLKSKIDMGGIKLEEFVSSAIQSGFAVAVSAYLLVRMEKRLEDLTQAISELRFAIAGQGVLKSGDQ